MAKNLNMESVVSQDEWYGAASGVRNAFEHQGSNALPADLAGAIGALSALYWKEYRRRSAIERAEYLKKEKATVSA